MTFFAWWWRRLEWSWSRNRALQLEKWSGFRWFAPMTWCVHVTSHYISLADAFIQCDLQSVFNHVDTNQKSQAILFLCAKVPCEQMSLQSAMEDMWSSCWCQWGARSTTLYYKHFQFLSLFGLDDFCCHENSKMYWWIFAQIILHQPQCQFQPLKANHLIYKRADVSLSSSSSFPIKKFN